MFCFLFFFVLNVGNENIAWKRHKNCSNHQFWTRRRRHFNSARKHNERRWVQRTVIFYSILKMSETFVEYQDVTRIRKKTPIWQNVKIWSILLKTYRRSSSAQGLGRALNVQKMFCLELGDYSWLTLSKAPCRELSEPAFSVLDWIAVG